MCVRPSALKPSLIIHRADKKEDKKFLIAGCWRHPHFFMVIDKKQDKKWVSGNVAKLLLIFEFFAP